MSGTTEPSAPDLGQGESDTPGTLSGQKRARDYGEELKGLPESDNENGPNDQGDLSTSALKKQKINHSGNDDDSDLDDGEIVESSPSPRRNPASPAHDEFNAQAVAGHSIGSTDPETGIGLGVAAHEPSEDGEIDAFMDEAPESTIQDEPFVIDKNGTRPQHSGWNQGVSLGARTSFRKPTTQLFPTTRPTEAQNTHSTSLPLGDKAEGEYFRGIKRAEDKINNKDKDGKGSLPTPSQVPKNSKSQPPLTFNFNKITWYLPHQIYRVKNNSINPQKFWEGRIGDWVRAFIYANASVVDVLDVDVIREVFKNHVSRTEERLLIGDEENVKLIRDAAPDVLAGYRLGGLLRRARQKIYNQEHTMLLAKREKEDNVLSQRPRRKEGIRNDVSLEKDTTGGKEPTQSISIEEAPKFPSSNEEAPTFPSSNEEAPTFPPRTEEEEEEELRLQRRYFPGAKDPSIYCINCSGVGHRSRECPLLQCKFCGSREHILFACPTRQRCSKCRQLGHDSKACKERLTLLEEEEDGCAFCGVDHSEEKCTEIWRSFTLSTEVHKKVKNIPAFCYTCGGLGHYGPECGLTNKRSRVTGKTTWSEANRLLYVDQESTDLAIAWANVDLNQLQPESFHSLKKSGKLGVHTHFVSSDESEEDFIHAPVKKPEPRGEIRISSNISSIGQEPNRGRARRNNDQSHGHQNERDFSPPPPRPLGLNVQSNGVSSWQPPLLPGPPLSLGDHSVQTLEPPPSGSLLPRLPASNSGAGRGTANNRGGQNGRGGRGSFRGSSRGGGRGRGRGRGK
ncbi:hypothetical protein K449DRAFT_380531 [Hypoxylon sp. EC38]|nr:hypothetical protein K449DRAFT_380531 [Hypoxylon sp. EC38]